MDTKPLTSDDLRHQILEQFDKFRPNLAAYHDYAERVHALSLEYHAARFRELLPNVPVEELSLVATLESAETPKSCDVKLAQVLGSAGTGINIKRIIFDRAQGRYSLYA